METIHDLPGWGNANHREIHVRKEAIEWVNSEQRSATKFPISISRRRRMYGIKFRQEMPSLSGKK
ncbi:hypothetical protein LZ012_13915 [Dechloromonas sp. XY25]|uniref:Uncharacterized protein n=1 Tax=Dechloromonas hankyongensis TaxID=2908002 RepID=A0ABS9K4I0_9RHOO|nr:hypothetical protein [Dechloromonas hankyongensis]MCG2578086.1 hypothetical protein [Dechloromonas hankyongensis]